MNPASPAPWAIGPLPESPARERGAPVPLRRLLAWAAPVGASVAVLAVAAGVAFRDRCLASAYWPSPDLVFPRRAEKASDEAVPVLAFRATTA